MEKSSVLFKKCGYKRQYNNSECVVYHLKKKQDYSKFPETIIIRKKSYEVEFESDNIDEHLCLGTVCMNLDYNIIQAIYQKIEELKMENLSK